MMNKIITLLFCFSVSICEGQNLVTNPGFETYSSLPNGAAQWSLAVGWSNCSGTGSPDYGHTSGTGYAALPNNYFATVYPHSGDALMGFILWHYSGNFREYLSTTLSSPMVVGQQYDVSFYITNGVFNGNYGGFACDQVSVAFSTTPLTQISSGYISVVPEYTYPGILQDTGWVLVSFSFIPTQPFEFITIGNFVDDASTTLTQFASSGFDAAYYFIDDISVEQSSNVPIAAFLAANDICPGTCTDFTNLSQNATSYLWNFPGASPSTSTDINPSTICYNTPGQYDVELIATNANGSDTLTLANYITVYPYPPAQGITQSGDTLFAIPGAVTYQWYHDGVLVPGATDYYYVASSGGNFNVVATDANGCEVEAVIFDVVASVYDKTNEPEINIFPNPVSDKLYIQNSSVDVGEVKVMNCLGQSIPVPMRYLPDQLPTVGLDVSGLPKGVYFIELGVGFNLYYIRFVKQ